MEITLSPETLTKLDNAVTECVNSLTRTQGEKDFRKSVLDRMKEEIDGFKPADFNALVLERYDDRITNKIAKMEAVVEMNDALNDHRRKTKVKQNPAFGEETATGPEPVYDEEEEQDGA